jgi:hypothetical protein
VALCRPFVAGDPFPQPASVTKIAHALEPITATGRAALTGSGRAPDR